MKNALASTVANHNLENSEFFVHQRASLKEILKETQSDEREVGITGARES